MFSLRTHCLISLGLLAALIAAATSGPLLQSAGLLRDLEPIRRPALIAVFALFLAFGFSTIPVMVMSAMRGPRRRPADAVAPGKAATAPEKVIVWALWALLAAGVVTALPAMVKDGVFEQVDSGAP